MNKPDPPTNCHIPLSPDIGVQMEDAKQVAAFYPPQQRWVNYSWLISTRSDSFISVKCAIDSSGLGVAVFLLPVGRSWRGKGRAKRAQLKKDEESERKEKERGHKLNRLKNELPWQLQELVKTNKDANQSSLLQHLHRQVHSVTSRPCSFPCCYPYSNV